MKTLRLASTIAVLAGGLAASHLSSPLQAAEVETLIDFTDSRRDPDGTVFHAYEFVWDTWNKHVLDLPRRGTLIQAPSGSGVMGENKTMVDFRDCHALHLHFVIGNQNSAQKLVFTLEDSDGTVQAWNIPLAGLPVGREVRQLIDPAKSDNEEKPGKKPGLNLKKISTWQIKGDWSAANVEVLLLRLTADK